MIASYRDFKLMGRDGDDEEQIELQFLVSVFRNRRSL